MSHSLDTIIERRNTACLKWDGIEGRYGVKGDDLLPMWVADMEFRPPVAVVDALARRAAHGICGYPADLEAYHRSIQGWMRRRHGWDIREEWISSTPGVVCAVNLLIRTLTNRGDGVVLQAPVYFPFFRGVEENGCRVIHNPLRFDGTRYVMDFEDLERKLDQAKLLVLCSPHNPVGRVWTREELLRLGQLCVQRDVVIISDEIHGDLTFAGHRHTAFATLSEELAQHSVVCTSPSKTFNLPGLQPGMVIIPNPRLRRDFVRTLRACGIPEPNIFCQEAVKASYDHGEPWLDDLLGYLEENDGFLRRFVAEDIPPLRVVRSEGTYLTWLDCRALGLEPKALEQLLLTRARLVLSQGYTFGPGGEGFVRMNIACPRSMLEDALGRLASAINSIEVSR
ncbi:MAG TPA: MalY/PatB family protein [Candidatus Methylomirabilis sp.]|nr:MalY/PatB family protein [Candidatus Methylomirabilis sp.]